MIANQRLQTRTFSHSVESIMRVDSRVLYQFCWLLLLLCVLLFVRIEPAKVIKWFFVSTDVQTRRI